MTTQRIQQRRLATRCRTSDYDVASFAYDFAQHRDDAVVAERTEWQVAHVKASNTETRAVNGDRWNHDAHPRAVMQPRINDR